jgi:hypothetical protein
MFSLCVRLAWYVVSAFLALDACISGVIDGMIMMSKII